MLQSAVYVGLSGQLSLQRRLDTIAQNVANSGSAGYRAEEVKFESLISQQASSPVAYSSKGDTFLSQRSGELVPTGNPLDVAAQGNTWLSIQTPVGQIYTRDGRMRMLPTGELQTLTGYAVLDDGGAPVSVDPRGGPIEIGRNGVIRQGGRQTGRIGLFAIDPQARMSRFESSGVQVEGAVDPIVDYNTSGIAQGFMERSNVNPVLAMASLINVSKAFDALNTSMADTESTLRGSIDALGGVR